MNECLYLNNKFINIENREIKLEEGLELRIRDSGIYYRND